MSFRFRSNLVLIATFAVTLLISSVLMYRTLQEAAFDELRRAAATQMNMALTVRQYTSDHITPLMNQRPEEFHPEAVPSFAATRVMALLHKNHPGFVYREVSTNPLNPKNRAQPWEAEVVQHFRQTGASEYFFEHRQPQQEAMVHFARPLVVKSGDCLRCHGTPESAPAGVTRTYGTTNGYNWKIGDVIGAQITSVPIRQPLQEARQTFIKYLLASCAMFVALFAVLNEMLRRVVIVPMESASASFERMASEDALTGLLTRRKFMEVMHGLMQDANRWNRYLSLVVLDVDRFKHINDTFGHDAGDKVLRDLAGRCRFSSKRRDVLARYGGEEFIFALPRCNEGAATAFANMLRQAISESQFEVVGQVTASFGVAQMQPGESFEALFKRADRALYQAKQNGRNCVVADSELAQQGS